MANGNSSAVSPFEAIRTTDEQSNEYWSARDLAQVLGYTNWRNFVKVIEKAAEACENSGHAVADHFVEADQMVQLGSGAQRSVADWHLSRYACYLVVQNADPSKEIVALGQTYFAIQTRRAEVADELSELTEVQRRLFIRGQLRDHNRELAAAAQDAGVIQPRDFAIFQDHGYRGLYNGEGARDIAARKGVRPGQILEFMGSTELAANLFRATQTEEKLRREDIQGKGAANRTHHAVGREVRATIERLGGTMPENLPTPAESIQQLQRTEQERLAAERQPRLFGDTPEN
jgi:DNA-damage-inducible protein D